MLESDVLRLGCGLGSVGLIYVAVLYGRRWTDKPRLFGDVLDSRIHYAAAGFVLNYAAPEEMRMALGGAEDIAVVFLSGRFGMMVGASFDWRLLKRLTKPLLWLEISYVSILVMGVWLLTHGLFQGMLNQTEGGNGPLLWAVCGLGGAGWVRQRRSAGNSNRRAVGWFPSASALTGLLLAGIGLMQMRPGVFVIRQPLAFPQVIVVEGAWEQVMWCAVLGAFIGLMADLSTREVRRGQLYYWIGAHLLLGCGMAQVLGLEPLWVGGIAGIWLINATLRRIDMLRVLEQGQGLFRTLLPAAVGWGLGALLQQGKFDWIFGAWILLIIVVAVPTVRLGVWHGVGRFLNRSALRRTGVGARQLLEFDDLALVVGLGLAAALPADRGAALLAAVLLGQWILHLIAMLVAEKLAGLTG